MPVIDKSHSPARDGMEAYLHGRADWEAQTPRNNNPYPVGSLQRRKWWDGWDVGMNLSLAMRKLGKRNETAEAWSYALSVMEDQRAKAEGRRS